MSFLRTASTRRLLAAIATVLVLAGGGAAIAVAATTGGPTPPAVPLVNAVHTALCGPSVAGVSAEISFTDNLIDSSSFTGQASDPLLQGASGRLWADGNRLRIELQSDDGDAQIVVDGARFWISDPAQSVVYQGTLPPTPPASTRERSPDSIPSLARIQSLLTSLAAHVDLSGAQPSDVAGQPAYSVTTSPKTGGGLLGAVGLAFDAAHGVPLRLDVYARGNPTPVLGLAATAISYGAVPDSVFAISPPTGSKVVDLGQIGTPTAAAGSTAARGSGSATIKRSFALDAPATLAGRARTGIRHTHSGGVAAIGYGTGGGAVTVSEARASAGHGSAAGAASGSSSGGLSLPTRTVAGASATVLATPLGTIVHLTHGGTAFTVIGSVDASTALDAARGLF